MLMVLKETVIFQKMETKEIWKRFVSEDKIVKGSLKIILAMGN
jgi:hypothetical protein